MGAGLRNAGFDVLVLSAEEVQPEGWRFPGVKVLRLPMRDIPVRLEPTQVEDVRRVAAELSHHLARGRHVLVTCRAGLNRSGLIVAATLLQTTQLSPLQVIRLIRSRRNPIALNNPAFVHAIVTQLGQRRAKLAS